MRLFSITLASSLLLAIVSVAGLSDASSTKAVLQNSMINLQVTKQFAEAEEGVAAALSPILIASWTSLSTSTVATASEDTDTLLATPDRKVETNPSQRDTPTSQTLQKTVTANKTVTAPKPVAPPSQNTSYDLAAVRQDIHSRTNSARASSNLTSLSSDGSLATIAQKRSEDMVAKNYFSHTSKSGCDLTCRFEGLSYSVYGENLAEYYEFDIMTEPELVSTFMAMWQKSPGHRRNLPSGDFNREGVGVAMKGNRIVVTVIFGAL